MSSRAANAATAIRPWSSRERGYRRSGPAPSAAANGQSLRRSAPMRPILWKRRTARAAPVVDFRIAREINGSFASVVSPGKHPQFSSLSRRCRAWPHSAAMTMERIAQNEKATMLFCELSVELRDSDILDANRPLQAPHPPLPGHLLPYREKNIERFQFMALHDPLPGRERMSRSVRSTAPRRAAGEGLERSADEIRKIQARSIAGLLV